MKTAMLPTGEALQFDDGMDDRTIHKHIRAKMGLPPPPPNAEERAQEAMAQVTQMGMQLMQALTGVTEHLRQLVAHLGQVMQGMQVSSQEMQAAAQHITGAVVEGAQSTTSAAAGIQQTAGQLAEHMSGVAEHIGGAAQSVAGAAQRAEQASGGIDSVVKSLHAPIAHLTEAVKTPRRAVKGKDGSWSTVSGVK